MFEQQEVEVGKAICSVCKWEHNTNTKVEPKANFGGSFKNGKEYIENIIFNYWCCPKHGAVTALIGKKIVYNPLELFKGKIAVYEAEQAFPAYSTTAEEFKQGLFTDKYKTQEAVASPHRPKGRRIRSHLKDKSHLPAPEGVPSPKGARQA